MHDRDAQEHSHAAEEILGQYFYSLGNGANGQWITRKAIRAVRAHYFESILAAVKGGRNWDQDSPHVLDYLRAVGALAGDLALSDGRHSIEGDDVKQAIARVENNYQDAGSGSSASGPPFKLGAWCPPKPA